MEVGAQIVGVSSAWTQNDNTVKMPGFMVVNAFATFPVVPKVTLSLGVNNLFDRTGFTEGEAQDNGCCTPGGTPVYVARSVNGRSAKATLRYTF
jgi:outer membrane receptor protein involved in Fe transport